MKAPRPKTLPSIVTRVPTGHGNLYITITENTKGIPFEVFCTLGKSGQSLMAKAEVTGRLISLALRYEIPLSEIVDQLINIGGDKPQAYRKEVYLSIPDAVGKVLKERYLTKGETNGS